MTAPVDQIAAGRPLWQPGSNDPATPLIAANSTRAGVDTRGLAADLTGLLPAERHAMLQALDRHLTPFQQGELLRCLDESERANPPSAPPPEDRSMSLGDHVLDGGHQFGVGLWSMVKGVGALAGGVARTSYDTSPAGMVADGLAGMTGGQVPGWLPSHARGEARIGEAVTMARQAGAAIWNDPSILIKEYKDLAHEGRYGAIVGQALADFGDLLVGTHGAGTAAHGAEALADIAKIAHGAGVVADAGKVARASESAIALAKAAKADAAFGERAAPALEQARAALGAVDASRLTPEARQALSRATSELDGAIAAAAPRYMREAAATMPRTAGVLGRPVLALATHSPSLMSDLRAFDRAGGVIEVGKAGGGSYIEGGHMVLDLAMMSSPAQTMRLLAHEIGHYKFGEVTNWSSKSAFVGQRLRDEGAATLENIRVRREILASGGGDIGIAGNQANHAAYNQIYDEMLKTGDVRAAQNAVGRIFAQGEQASGTGMNYQQYYEAQYARVRPHQP